jgi:predicted DNA-binding transcriptional regulator YafY
MQYGTGMSEATRKQIVTITYTNWNGITSERTILPCELYWGSTEYHPEAQWLLRAIDQEKRELRTFAMRDIQNWAAPGKKGTSFEG